METKQCSKCKKVKPLGEFYRRATSTDGHVSQCKQCSREYKRQYYAEHPDCKYQYRAEHREELREYARKYSKQYRIDHPGKAKRYNQKYYINHRGEIAERCRQYRADNPERLVIYTQRRRAREAEAEGNFTTEQFAELCERYDNRCLCCGKVKELTIDHIVPLSKGGSNDIKNVQCLCGPCNSKKGTKTIDYCPDMVEQISEGENKK